jgi:carboxyl-terminal processing protease
MKLHTPSRTVGVASVGLVFLVATTIFAAQFGGNQATETQTVKLVSKMISEYHISKKPLDDRISAMILQRFIKDLDSQKLYFLKSDIDSFARYRDQLDDFLKAGQVSFAHEAFSLYLKRLDERVAYAHTLINQPQDFTVEESMVIDGDTIDWANDVRDLNERWRKRIKYELLSQHLDKKPVEDSRKLLHKRYDAFRKNENETEDSEVLERFLSSVAHCYDPHSSYMSPQTLDEFQIQMKLSLEGIGAALGSEDGMTIVKDIVVGGAADKDGRLKRNDKIIEVGQEDGKYQDVVGMRLNRVVRLIRGKVGTKVRLKVINESGETAVIELRRQTVELKSSEVKGEIIQTNDFGVQANNNIKGRVGVINIPSFYRDFNGASEGKDDFKSTARDVSKVLADFKAKGGVDAVIVDLRMNGGGALSEAIEVTGLFIDKGPVVLVKEQNDHIKSHEDEEEGAECSAPLVVVCNRLSASASEIFAGAIKDYGRGIIVGDTTTHGKGTVQNVMPVSSNLFGRLNPNNGTKRGALKLTINQFYRVNGDSTQNRGVESDVVLPSLIDHMDFGESFLDNALAFDHINPVQHMRYPYVNSQIVSTLKENSQHRIAADPEFQQVNKDIERYTARKNRKSVSLNEETLLKERDEEKAEKKVAKEEEEAENKSDKAPVLAKTEYNTELLAIAVDYAEILKAQKTAQKH